MYSSMIAAWTDIELWKTPSSQKDSFHLFWLLNHDIKTIIEAHTKKPISNWDVEHSFWNFRGNIGHAKTISNQQNKSKEKSEPLITTISESTPIEETETLLKSNFELSDYIIPKVAKLIELRNQKDKSAAAKGSEFEKLVAEIFKQLDFEVENLGQGTGRNPDAIIKFREENTAFLVDAKAYSSRYRLGIDDRAIKEYINHHCPRLQKEGYKKIGFIISK